GQHWTGAFLHRIRGEILLKGEPANNAPAEEAFLTAISVAQQQEARSCEGRCRWRSFINRRAGQPTRTTCSRSRSKAFCRRRNSRKSRKRKAVHRVAVISQ